MKQSLPEFLADLDQQMDGISLEDLQRRMEGLEIRPDEVAPYMRFGRECYQRNLLHAGTHYHALILCWRPGQRSPIHDHRGSNCGVLVLKGVATETLFDRTPDGLVYATHSCELPQGSITASHDQDVHQVSNLQPGDSDLVTLHIYSPPLLVMGSYSLTDDRLVDFVDPIFEFSMGSGI
jgi:cysteine dioxygenase